MRPDSQAKWHETGGGKAAQGPPSGGMKEVEYRAHYSLEDIHWWFCFRRNVVLDVLLDHVPQEADSLVLEIGCGTGGNLALLKKFYRTAGVEISGIAASLAREKAGCDVYLGDFRTVELIRWQDVRAVLLLDVLEHVPGDRAMLEDALRLLEPGSHVIITLPSSPWLWSRHDEALGHLRRYGRKDVCRLLRGLPVEVLIQRRLYWTILPMVALYRFTLGRMGSPGQSDLKEPLAVVNRFLGHLVSLEKLFFRWCRVPWGLSHFILLRKEGGSDGP